MLEVKRLSCGGIKPATGNVPFEYMDVTAVEKLNCQGIMRLCMLDPSYLGDAPGVRRQPGLVSIVPSLARPCNLENDPARGVGEVLFDEESVRLRGRWVDSSGCVSCSIPLESSASEDDRLIGHVLTDGRWVIAKRDSPREYLTYCGTEKTEWISLKDALEAMSPFPLPVGDPNRRWPQSTGSLSACAVHLTQRLNTYKVRRTTS